MAAMGCREDEAQTQGLQVVLHKLVAKWPEREAPLRLRARHSAEKDYTCMDSPQPQCWNESLATLNKCRNALGGATGRGRNAVAMPVVPWRTGLEGDVWIL